MAKCAICGHETVSGKVVHQGYFTGRQNELARVKQENAMLRLLAFMLAFAALILAALMIT